MSISSILFSQNSITSFIGQMEQGNFGKALNFYRSNQEIIEKKYQWELVVCYAMTGELLLADSLMEVYSSSPDVKNNTYHFCLGLLDHLNERFHTAKQHYKVYLRGRKSSRNNIEVLAKEAIRRIAQCEQAKHLSTDRSKGFVYMLDPPFNSSSDELGLHIAENTPSTFFFSSNRNGLHNANELFNIYSINESKMDSLRLVIGDRSYGSRLLTFFDEGYRAIVECSKDNEQVCIEQVVGFDSIYQAPFILYSGRHPSDIDFQFVDQSLLFFSSKRDKNLDSYDLYYVTKKEDGTWTYPMNLGSSINSVYDERYPFYDPRRGLLYFSSNGNKSLGGFDIFSVQFKKNGTIDVPIVNLGSGINSPFDEIAFTTNTIDNDLSYFSSNRPAILGGYNLYAVYEERIEKDNEPIDTIPLAVSIDTPSDSVFLTAINYDNLQYIPKKRLKDWASMMEKLVLSDSSTYFSICYHSHDPAPEVSNYFYGITYCKAMIEILEMNPLLKGRFQVIAYGNQFPLAIQSNSTEIDQMSRKLNNRIEWFSSSINSRYVQHAIRPFINPKMQAKSELEKTTQKSIHYRIRLLDTKYPHSIDHHIFTHFHVIKPTNKAIYSYFCGIYSDLSEARLQQVICAKKGFTESTIVPFMGGFPMTKEQIKQQVKNVPELTNFLD